MIQRIIIFMTCCFALSLSVYADNNQIDDSMAIIHLIAQMSQDKNLCAQIDAMNIISSQDIVKKYSYFCSIIDWSLKDFKKLDSIADRAMIKKKLYEVVDFHKITISQLLAMQRDSRRSVKDMMIILDNVPDSDYLQSSLQQLYHALHEVKKEIITLDKSSSIHAWYIYITLLFLQSMLSQGMSHVQLLIQQKVDQHIIMHQILYLSERFKQSILSDFTIEKRGML